LQQHHTIGTGIARYFRNQTVLKYMIRSICQEELLSLYELLTEPPCHKLMRYHITNSTGKAELKLNWHQT